MKQPAWPGFLLLAALLAPSAAHAHLVNSGIGPFYNGALHLIFSPLDMVWLVTLSLFAGAQDRRTGRTVVVAIAVAWLLAGAAGPAGAGTGMLPAANGAGLFLLGAMVALDLKVSIALATVIAAGLGGLIGFQNGLELQIDGGGWGALVGTVTVVFSTLLLLTSFVAEASAFALRIACRVLGSWASATGLLSIAWILAANR